MEAPEASRAEKWTGFCLSLVNKSPTMVTLPLSSAALASATRLKLPSNHSQKYVAPSSTLLLTDFGYCVLRRVCTSHDRPASFSPPETQCFITMPDLYGTNPTKP